MQLNLIPLYHFNLLSVWKVQHWRRAPKWCGQRGQRGQCRQRGLCGECGQCGECGECGHCGQCWQCAQSEQSVGLCRVVCGCCCLLCGEPRLDFLRSEAFLSLKSLCQADSVPSVYEPKRPKPVL